MQLSAELFSSIVSSLQSDERNSVRHEKRKEGRVGVRCYVEVTPQVLCDTGPKPIRVQVRDISPSGMGFLVHEAMRVGLQVLCKLPTQDQTIIEVMMTVRHCIRLSKDLYSIGVSFAVSAIKKPEPAEATVA